MNDTKIFENSLSNEYYNNLNEEVTSDSIYKKVFNINDKIIELYGEWDDISNKGFIKLARILTSKEVHLTPLTRFTEYESYSETLEDYNQLLIRKINKMNKMKDENE